MLRKLNKVRTVLTDYFTDIGVKEHYSMESRFYRMFHPDFDHNRIGPAPQKVLEKIESIRREMLGFTISRIGTTCFSLAGLIWAISKNFEDVTPIIMTLCSEAYRYFDVGRDMERRNSFYYFPEIVDSKDIEFWKFGKDDFGPLREMPPVFQRECL